MKGCTSGGNCSAGCNSSYIDSEGFLMALTQMQIIQSLGEAMSWFERELAWGVPPTELRHLCGRMGELYAALITNGQMATEVNQQGYDVVSGAGERVSVKTTAMSGSSGQISFNPKTLDLVDRVIILRMNTEDMQIETLLNVPVEEAKALMGNENQSGKCHIALSKLVKTVAPKHSIGEVREASYQGYVIRELETGTIEIEKDGVVTSPAKPVLRTLANQLGVGLLNNNGNPYNTRQLGSLVLSAIDENGSA